MDVILEQGKAQTYAAIHNYGGDGDQDELAADPKYADATPNTQRRVIREDEKKEVKKLGCGATYLTLMKGFVCVGVLYLPKSFASGGWGMSIICMTLSATITTYCACLLLECQEKLGCKSYAEIGE